MKRYVSIIISLMLCLSIVTGCSGKSQPANQADNPKDTVQPTASPKINYPAKTIEIIVPYAAGGGQDVLTRAIEKYWALEKPIAVINKPGSGAKMGTTEVMRSNPDGYTLLSHTMALVIGYYADVYDTPVWREVEPVACITTEDSSISVNVDSKWNTIEELIDYAKKNPGKLNVGFAGIGGTTHTLAAGFANKAGIEVTYVPFAGGADTKTALAGGHIDVMCSQISEAIDMVRAGKFRMLAISGEQRNKGVPDVPTLKEKGIDFVYEMWRGIFAPKGTPKEVISIVEAELKKITENPEFVSLMSNLTYKVNFVPAEEFTEVMEEGSKLIEPLAPLLKPKE